MHHYIVTFGAGSEKRAAVHVAGGIRDLVTSEQQRDNLAQLVGACAIRARVQAVLTQWFGRALWAVL